MESSKKTGPAAIIGSVLFLLFFFGSIVAMFVFAKTNPPACIIVFGLYFLVFGLIALSKIKFSLRKAWILLFPLIGIGTASCGAIVTWGNEDLKEKVMYNIPLMLLAVFFFAGILLIVSAVSDIIHKKKVCTVPITAICTDIKSRLSSTNTQGRNNRVYCPVFSYYYDGVEYTSSEDVYTNVNVPRLNDEMEICINPDNPNEFSRKSNSSQITFIIIGSLFIIASVGSFIFFF